jgi:predicted acyltransferase
MNTTDSEKNRLISLDIFRGIAIAGMILVNNQGDWSHVYPALRHAAWHGWSGADVVFPFFLFALGASLHFAFTDRLRAGEHRKRMITVVFRRAAILILLGLFLNLFPDFDPGSVRIPGVLQRIGLCYCSAALIFLYAGQRSRIVIASLLLIIYCALITLVTPHGIGHGSLEPCCNLPGYVDSVVFAGHTYEHAQAPGFDPEGLLSTIPSIVSTLIGMFAAGLMGSAPKKWVAAAGGAAMSLSGLALDFVIPINKNLWTPSYTLFMGGLATIVFTLLHYLFDAGKRRRPAMPFIVLGRNAITVYILSSLAGKGMVFFTTGADGGPVPLKTFIHRGLFASWLDPYAASLCYAAAFLLFWTGIMYILYRKKIFISV